MVAAWGGIANGEPPMVSVAIRHTRYSDRGVRQNLAFSVNVPSVDMVKETDYCGIYRGSEINKIEDCQFKVFYGKLGNIPLIEQCPVNLECKVMHILDLGSHSLFIGRIEEIHISEGCLTNGEPDVDKIRPFACVRSPDAQYYSLGKYLGKAYTIGRELKEVE